VPVKAGDDNQQLRGLVMKIPGCRLGAAACGADRVWEEDRRLPVKAAARQPRIRTAAGIGAMGLVALALAACGGGGGGGTPSSGGGGGSPPPPPSQYTIGGAVTGLSGTGLVLQDNGGDNLSVSQSGNFTFATKVNSGGAYAVTVMTQPTGQTCTVANGSGTATANVTNVAVSCAATAANVTIGGTVSGMAGTGLTLQDNGGDDLKITQNGAFTFQTALASGTAYTVTVSAQPSAPSQTCTLTNATGTTASANITNVTVACVTSAGKFAYVANNGDGTISGYTIDPTSGQLTSTGSPVSDGTAPAAVSLAPNGNFAFSANTNGTQINAYSIDPTSGALKPVGTYPTGFATGSAYPDIAVSPNSKFLYLASAGDNQVAGFAIAADGSLTPVPNSPIAAGSGAGAIPAFSPNGNFLYVMDQNPTSGPTVGNAVSAYSIDPTSGQLTPVPGSPFAAGTTPTWIAFTPNGNFAYVSNSGEDTISAYSVDSTGALHPLPTATYPTNAHPADLTIDTSGTHLYAPVSVGTSAGAIDVYSIGSDGSLTQVQYGSTAPVTGVGPVFLDIDPAYPFAYIADRAGAEVYGYSIDPNTGALTPVAGSPFGTGAGSEPQFITIDPSGKFGYTANEGTANLSQFAIDPTTGKLNPIGTGVVSAGLKPIFVSISPEAMGIRD
jgi:6-phosphogluconolactonase (cycloisomerase 2 family)